MHWPKSRAGDKWNWIARTIPGYASAQVGQRMSRPADHQTDSEGKGSSTVMDYGLVILLTRSFLIPDFV